MNKWFAEILGTFALVFFGTGAIVVNQQSAGAVTHVGIAITFGLVVMVMIHSLGAISGAHMNPAVTIGFVLAKRFPLNEALPYIASQLAGALLASYTLKFLFPSNGSLGVTLPSGAWHQSFVLEAILSFFLMFVILNVATGSKEQGLFAGLAIGATVLIEALMAGPICGASMNPARSIAPAVASGEVTYLWVYIVAPIAGAALAVPAHTLIQHKKQST